MERYSKKVMNHFLKPKNLGSLKNASGVGELGNLKCGDIMRIYIEVENNPETNEEIIKEIKFKTLGCAAAIATSSMITELAKGKTIEEGLKITRSDVAKELDGLPPIKLHCSNLAADALHLAINNYLENKKKVLTKSEEKDLTIANTEPCTYINQEDLNNKNIIENKEVEIMRVNEHTKLGKIIKLRGVEKILQKYNVPCLSCPMAKLEIDDLEIGAVCDNYGINKTELILELNQVLKKRDKDIKSKNK